MWEACTWVAKGGSTKPITRPVKMQRMIRAATGRWGICMTWVIMGERLVPYSPI